MSWLHSPIRRIPPRRSSRPLRIGADILRSGRVSVSTLCSSYYRRCSLPTETGAIPNMANGLVARIADRIVANARVVKGAPEAIAFLGIMTLGLSYLVLQEFHRER